MPLAYRYWSLKEDKLISPFRTKYIWTPRANWAKCLPPYEPLPADITIWDGYEDDFTPVLCRNSSPNKDCKQEFGCGLYANLDPETVVHNMVDVAVNPPKIMGLVYGWGHVLYHGDGIVRCEIMDIWAMCAIPKYFSNSFLGDFAYWAIKGNIPFYVATSKAEAVQWLKGMSIKLLER